MAESRIRGAVVPGAGVVATYGDVAVVLAAGDDGFTESLLRRIQSGHSDPRALVWQIIGLAAVHQPGVPAFAIAVGEPRARRVLVHGAARAVIDGDEYTGADLWTIRELDVGPHHAVALTVAPGPVVAGPASDIPEGTLVGAGLVLEPAVAAPRPPPAVPLGTAIRAVALETVQLADRIAALQGDDGSRVPLDRNYVFGRDPRQDPAVVRGAASPIQVDDEEHLISRVHAYVTVTGTQVAVRDAHSANGTFIAAPGDQDWTRVGRDPVPVPEGHSLRFGLRVYTHMPADDLT